MEAVVLTAVAVSVAKLFLSEKGAAAPFSIIVDRPLSVAGYFALALMLSSSFYVWPYFMLGLYMVREGFFSYEIFYHDSVPVVSSHLAVFYLFFAVLILLPVVTYRFAGVRWSLLVAVLPLLAVLGLLAAAAISGSPAKWQFFGSLFTLILVLAAAMVYLVAVPLGMRFKYWMVPGVATILFFAIPFVFSDAAVGFVNNSLRMMRLGGIEVELIGGGALSSDRIGAAEDKTRKKWCLLFRSDSYLYVRPVYKEETCVGVSDGSGTGRIVIAPMGQWAVAYTP